MKKYFIAEEEIIPDKDFGQLRRPKGVGDILVNWSAVDLGKKGFLVLVDTPEIELMTQLSETKGILVIEDNPKSKTDIEQKLGKTQVFKGGDMVSEILKSHDPLFEKDNIKIG